MPVTGEQANIGLNAMWHTANRWVGAAQTSVATAVEASAAGTKIKKAQALANGNIIYFTVISGGLGLVALRPYYVIEKAAGEFALAREEGGAAIAFTTELKAASEYVVVTEMTGGAYVRIETAFGLAVGGKLEDVTEHALKIPAGKTINAEIYNEAKEGTYTVKSSESDMNEASGTPAP
jgi:hypothetical protein